MSDTIKHILTLACLVPIVVGFLKYKKIDKKYHFFLYMMIVDMLIELCSFSFNFFSFPKKYMSIAFHIHLPLYFFLSLQFIFLNGFISKNIKNSLLLASLPVLLFNLWFNKWVFMFPYYFLSYVSTVMLFIFMYILGMQVLSVNNKMLKNCWFWISSFSILYHAFTLLIFGLYFFSLFNTPNGRSILDIHHYVNALTYIVFAFAIYKIPEKNNFNFQLIK
jgi:hypothetical protein